MGYVFEISADKLISHYDKDIVGKDMTKGILNFYRGTPPTHDRLGPPYLDETKLKEDELENLRRW